VLFVVVLITVFAHSILPWISLLRQAGGGEDWSFHRLAIELNRAMSLHALLIADSMLWAVVAGICVSILAVGASWLALDSRGFRLVLFITVIALWCVPGPVLGFGLKETINWLMDGEDFLLAWTTARPIRTVLYDFSTPFPVMWAHIARFFPYAVAIVWPAVRDISLDLREASRVDGANNWIVLRRVIWPASRRAFWTSVLVVTAFSVGELSTSKLVQVPGRPTYVQELFSQMHYGSTATTAALALVLLVPAAALCGAVSWIRR
jgi:ABC-type Fe3+ transport system permease subunit